VVQRLNFQVETIIIFFFCLFGVVKGNAQISASTSSGCAPLIGVEFSHSYSGASNFLWSFGNGASSTNSSATNTYQNPGVYTVQFTADPNIQETISITVLSSPVADFSVIGSGSGCVPLSVSFQDNSTSDGTQLVNWSWDFGDGGVQVGTDDSPSHLYTLVGVNDVTLVVEDENGCEGSVGFPDLVTASTEPDLTLLSDPVSTSACNPPLDINFSADASSNSPATDELTYFWDLGDGNTFDGPNPDVLNYTENGSYPISVTVTDDSGCSSFASDDVFIGSPQADWELIGGPNFCDTVYFENLSDAASTTANWGNGESDVINSSLDTLMYVYDSPGTFTASITTSSPGCSDTDEVTVIIDEVEADFVSSPQFSCNPELTTTYTSTSIGAESYLWIFGNDSISGPSEVEYTHVSAAEVDPYLAGDPQLFGGTLEIVSEGGCFASVSLMNDTIWVPFSYFAIDVDDGCAPITVTFSDSSSAPSPIVSWEYFTGDGNVITADNPDQVTYTYTEPGDFESFLVITTESGCTDTSLVIPIEVGTQTNPLLDFGPVQVCPGEQVDFNALMPADDDSDMWTISADNNQISGCPYDANFSGGFNAYAGQHPVTLSTSYNGCISTTTYFDAVEVLGPVGHFNSILNCDDPYTVEFIGDISGADSWTFDFGDGTSFSSSSEETVEHTYASTGDYSVSLTSFASTGCPPFVETLTVRIREVEAVLETPDLFCQFSEVSLDGSASQDVHVANGDGYAWVFDAGMTPAPYRTESSTVSFDEENTGDFNVDLIVYDVNGCADTASIELNVFGVDVEIGFEVGDACIPLEAEFWDLTETDTLVASWDWDFGGGNSSPDSSTTFNFDGSINPPYQISLTVTDELGCSDTESITLSPDIPNAGFSATDTQLCAGDVLSFSANNSQYPIYEWIFNNGETGIEPTETTSYPDAGTYDVTLIVQNDAGCYDTLTVSNYIEVQSYPEVGFSSSADGLSNLCYPILIEFTDTTDAIVFDYLDWDLGTGFPVVDNPTVGTIYEEPGMYTVSLEVGTTFGCIGSFDQDYEIEGPVADFVLSSNEICLYDSVRMEIIDSTDVSYFSWEFGNGVDSAMTNPVTYFYDQIPSGGSTNIQLITWSADSTCSATTEYPFQVNQTIADFDRNNETALEDTIHCFGLKDELTNNSVQATGYFWDFGNGFNSLDENVSQYYTAGGSYDITLMASNENTGCSDTITKQIIVHPPMQTSAENGLACESDTIYLAAYGGETYRWQPETYVNDANSQFPYLTVDFDSELEVLITDSNDCSQAIEVIADYIRPAPQPVWSDTVVDYGNLIDFVYDEQPYQIHNWFSSSLNVCNGCDQGVILPDASNVYGVSVSDELGCFVDTFYFQVTVLDEMLFWMPNAFTPNQDGYNDLFYPEVTRALPDGYEFLIFNRNGELIWETNDINAKWAGNFQNSEYYTQPEMYVWKVKIQNLRSTSYEFMGTVTLIR